MVTATGQPAVDNTGKLTYTLAPNMSGTATFMVAVRDNGGNANGGVDTSAPQIFTITASLVNDQPSFTATSPPVVSEDSGTITIANWATFNPGGAPDANEQS